MKPVEEIIRDEAKEYAEKYGILDDSVGKLSMKYAYIAGRSKSIESEKAKDERIKKLENAIGDLYASIVDVDFYNSRTKALKNAIELINSK